MTSNEKLKLLEKWNGQYNALYESWEKISEVFGDCLNSEMFNNTFEMFDAYTEAVAKLVGDDNEWLFWWIFECEQGKNNGNVKIGKKKFKSNSVKDLLKIIEAKP